MKNSNFNEKHDYLKPLILLLIDTHFHKILVFLLMVYREKLKMLLFRKSLKPLNLLAYKGIFKKKLIFFEWYMEKLIFVDK